MHALDWLPPTKSAAVVFTIDDVHPATSHHTYEAGGDLGRGALGHVEWLLDRCPKTWVTLFTTPDWRQISPRPTRTLLARLPWADRLFLAPMLPRGTLALERHPEFVAYLNAQGRMEVACHGLHHIHRGPRIPVEFQEQDAAECRRMLERARAHFGRAGLHHVPGFQPPGWNLPDALSKALVEAQFRWVAAARDIVTPIGPGATTAMSGPLGRSLIYPELQADGLLHFTSNFQATSDVDRALAIVEFGGLVAIKAHIVKNAMGHVAPDGVDAAYTARLAALFQELDRRYGDAIWWTSMGQIADRVLGEPQ